MACLSGSWRRKVRLSPGADARTPGRQHAPGSLRKSAPPDVFRLGSEGVSEAESKIRPSRMGGEFTGKPCTCRRRGIRTARHRRPNRRPAHHPYWVRARPADGVCSLRNPPQPCAKRVQTGSNSLSATGVVHLGDSRPGAGGGFAAKAKAPAVRRARGGKRSSSVFSATPDPGTGSRPCAGSRDRQRFQPRRLSGPRRATAGERTCTQRPPAHPRAVHPPRRIL